METSDQNNTFTSHASSAGRVNKEEMNKSCAITENAVVLVNYYNCCYFKSIIIFYFLIIFSTANCGVTTLFGPDNN